MNSDTFWKQEGHLKNEVKTACTERDGGLNTMDLESEGNLSRKTKTDFHQGVSL